MSARMESVTTSTNVGRHPSTTTTPPLCYAIHFDAADLATAITEQGYESLQRTTAAISEGCITREDFDRTYRTNMALSQLTQLHLFYALNHIEVSVMARAAYRRCIATMGSPTDTSLQSRAFHSDCSMGYISVMFRRI